MKKFLSISLAFLMLFSSSGLTLTSHYCDDYLIDSKLAFGYVNLDCGMAMDGSCDSKHSSKPSNTSIGAKGCCENEFVSAEVENQFKAKIQKLTIDTKFVSAFAHTFLQLNFVEKDGHPNFSDYSPPPLEPDIRVLFQTFLI